MDSRKSEATRRNIWRLPVHDENRSKTISANKESMELQQHRSRPTTRATARNCCRLREVLQRHRELAAQYGHQADRVVASARQHSHTRCGRLRLRRKRL